MECSVGRELAGAFAVAARQYADTVAKLGRLNTEKLDFAQILKAEEEILRRAAEAVGRAENARMEFESHIRQHRCQASVA
jgi:hypothetical protein